MTISRTSYASTNELNEAAGANWSWDMRTYTIQHARPPPSDHVMTLNTVSDRLKYTPQGTRYPSADSVGDTNQHQKLKWSSYLGCSGINVISTLSNVSLD